MPVPGYQEFMRPLLEALSDGREQNVREAYSTVADRLHLTEADRQELIPSGTQRLLDNRATVRPERQLTLAVFRLFRVFRAPEKTKRKELKMPRLTAIALLLSVAINAHAVAQSSLSPQELWWPNADRKSGTPKGLLYAPELLAALVAGKPPEAIPATIAQAIREQTPIVVMWTFQDGSSVKDLSRPFHASISEPRAVNAVAPVWEKQEAADLRAIDPYTRFGEVGVMAAFPRNTLQPGRLIFLYAELPDDGTGRIRGVQVFAELPRLGGGDAAK